MPWPLIAVHAAMTPDGRVLTYGTDTGGKQTGYFVYDIWDPSAGLNGGHMTLNNLTLTDIFCSSQVILPLSEEILIAGGDNWTGTGTTNTGNNNSNLFDYRNNTLARSQNMNRARWYSSTTVLVNGDAYIQGGSGGADRPEVRQSNGAFRLLSNVNTGGFAANFPRNFLAPDGRVFGYDTSGRMYFVDPAGTGTLATAGQIPSANVGWTSSAAMFRPGKILQIGGNSNGTAIIDINGPTPTVTIGLPMSTQRQWVSATVLPDGRVLATGGSQQDNALVGVNNFAEIWDPATGQWEVGTAGARARLYHSSALLLPDATVLVAGGGAPGPQTNTNAEIYYPPYLYTSSGALAPRPQIVSAPTTADVGTQLGIQVAAGDDISRVTLVKTGSVTHSVNMDQRFVELPFTQSANVVFATLPARASDTPPGFYHLFVLNDKGVPSKAKMVKINVDPTPNVAVDYTPSIGGGGGSPFALACDVDETLVGVHGRWSSTAIDQIGPQCVRVDQFGRWIGNPELRPVTGTTSTGTAFNKICPRDFAVSGFAGRSGTLVNQLDIQCRALTPAGGLTGNGQFLGAVGNTGGTAQGAMSCGTENPVYALYGRSGARIDAFGVQCRQAAITPISVNSTPVVVNPGTRTSVVGTPVDLAIQASDGDLDPLTFSATGLPAGLSIHAVTGRITGTPTTAGSYNVVVTVDDGDATAGAAFTWNIEQSGVLTVTPMPPQPPRPIGTAINYTATVSGGVNVRFNWQFGDGTPATGFGSSPSTSHVFANPGIYNVTLTVIDDAGSPIVQSFVQAVHRPLTSGTPRHSTNIVYETRAGANARVWVVNQDNNSISVFDTVTRARVAEIAVGAAPRGVAIAPDTRVWVTNRDTATISILSPVTLNVVQTVALPPGSQPYGMVFSSPLNQAFVVLEGRGELVKLDAANGSILGTLNVGPRPRHVSIDGTGSTLYVSRFITPPQPGEATAAVVPGPTVGGELVTVQAASLTVLGPVVLLHSDKPDAENQGGGVPNYLGPAVISPDGTTATVPSKQDNIARGTLRSAANLNFQNTVRAIASRIDLTTRTEDYGRRIDLDNASLASAAVYDAYSTYLFVALETSREVAVVDAYGATEIFRFEVGRAPQGLAISPDGRTLFVNNFMDRTVGVFDLTELQTTGQHTVDPIATLASVSTEALTPTVLLGKQLFYDARDTRLARDRYMSCASCHNDGGHDGRTWDLTGMGEGLRNTISLRGTGAAHGRLHWSSNFDEVQDFEGQIRSLAGGTGLMSDGAFNTGTRSAPLGDPKAGISAELDALAAYVASLTQFPDSPYRNANGTLTAAGEAGKAVFRRENCAACHSGAAFSDSASNALHDIGTLKPTSGSRLGGQLTGIDTPTLRGVWQTAPYLHDGSAATLAAAVSAHSGVSLNSTDMNSLVAYLQQIDARETSAPSATLPVLAFSFDEGTGTTVLDRSGNGANGTVNGATWNTQGRFGGSLTFDGVNDWVTVADRPSLDLTTGMTLEAWVYPTSAGTWRNVMIKERPGGEVYNLYAPGGTSAPVVYVIRTNDPSLPLDATGTASLPLNTWTHLAATYDGSTLRLYVNATQVASRSIPGSLLTSNGVLRIGGNSIWGEFFQGRIDEIRIYDQALPAADLLADMNKPVGTITPDTTPPVVSNGQPSGTLAAGTTQVTLSVATNEAATCRYDPEPGRAYSAMSATFSSTGGTTHTTTVSGLANGTSYDYFVRCQDPSGNASTSDLAIVFSIANPPVDTMPPVVSGGSPSGTLAAGTTTATLAATTNEQATCRYSTTSGVAYASMTGTMTATNGGTSHSASLSGLVNGNSYAYYVRCRDVIGNTNTSDFSIAFSVATPPPPDVTPPTVAISAPAAGSTVTGSVTLLAAASDNIGVVGVQFFVDGVAVGAEDTVAPYSIGWNSTSVANGAHTVTARARDAAGNQTTSAMVSITVNNAALGLVAAYGFDETSGTTVTDRSGNNLNGTISGATRTAQGKYGRGLSFDGVNDWVTVNDAAALDLTTGMTLEAWVYPTATGSAWRNVIIKERPTGEVYNLYAAADPAPVTYVIRAAQPALPLDAGAPSALPVNTWTHLAATYDGSTLRLFVNGVQTGSRAVSGPLLTSNGALRIGGNSIWGEFFQGQIDEVRVYNRALSTAELQTDMNTPVTP